MKYKFLLLFMVIMMPSMAQSVYDKLWKEVETLELDGKTRSASLVVDNIMDLAEKEDKGDHIIKAFLYQSKFLLLLEEESQVKIIKNLEDRIEASEFPVRNILESVYGSCLSAYLSKNSHNIRKRIPVDSSHADLGFEVWAISDFIREMESHFLNSLNRSEELSKSPIEDYELVLTKSNISKKYRPSLLDFLGHRAISQITKERWYANHKDMLYAYQKEFYAVNGNFLNSNINRQDSTYLLRTRALDIFKTLQVNHTKSKDTTALASVILQRIKYCNNISTFKERDSVFIGALKEAYKLFSKHEVSALIGYELAEYYYQKSLKSKAHELCLDIINRFPNSDGGTMAAVLKNNIESKSINHQMNAYNLPDQPILIGINYKNIDSLQLFAYRVNREVLNGMRKKVADSTVLRIIKKQKPVKRITFPLSAVNDFMAHSTELGFPSLPTGSYLLVSSNRLNPKTIKDIYSYSEFNVSQLSVISLEEPKHVVYKVLDRKEGIPIEGAFIEMTDNGLPMFSGYTDSNGEIRYKLEDKYYRNRKIIVSFNGDTLKKQNFRMPYGYGFDEDEEEHIARTFLYLDRKIYRPGQTLYFKGVLVDYKNGKRTVKPNKYVSVFINDSKGNELKEFRLKTNKFGSVSGEFRIPKSILTGEFSIDLYEDYDSEEDGYYDNLDDIYEAEEYFLVEEYKRPRFKVEFQPYKKSNVFGDSIVLSGSAVGFSGINVSNANVNYKVQRTLENRWLYRNNLSSNTMVKEGNVSTDSNGEYKISFLAYPDSSIVVDPSHVFKYTVSVDVTDLNGETQSASKDVRLGYHNMKVSASMRNSWQEDDPQDIVIKTTNLNGESIDAKYKLSIYKLKEPSDYLKSKQWPVVDRPIYSKDEFRKLFPYEPYDSLDFETNWPKHNMVTSYQRSIGGQDTVKISDFNGWQPGRYRLEIKAQNDNGEIDSLTRSITLIKQREPIFDNALFSFFVKDKAFGRSGYVDIEMSSPFSALNVGVQASHDGKVFYRGTHLVDNGNKVIRIPLTSSIDRQIHINLYAVKHNEFHGQNFNVELNSPDEGYEIYAQVFRNKLMPDEKENWIFKIVSQDGKRRRLEALASMYDSSLDEFATHNWTNSFNSNDYYPNIPDVETDFFQLAYSKVFSHQVHYNYYNIFKNFSRLNWFGFDFSSGTYSNKAYLSSLSNRLEQPKIGKGNVSGTIVSAIDGLPLPGISVIIEGTAFGTQTDFDGYYSLDAPKGSVLVFSFVGMTSVRLEVNKAGTYNVSMEEDIAALDEVVIVGYGTQTKKASAGVTTIVSANNIETLNIIASLTGEAAGVEIINASGQPGAVSTVRIRGYGSIKGSNTPLYVVDGVPVEAGQLIDINAADIASTSILKDATATAIYGSRGANGVVLITTKQGIEELTQVEARTNLKETAFFYPHLKSNKQGEISFSFEAPQALAKWRMMLLAHDKKGRTGYLEQTVVTQKQLSVTPNPPRFLRETDTIRFSAKISNLTEQPLAGSAMLQLLDGLSGTLIDSEKLGFDSVKSFTTLAKGNDEVSWTLVIPKHLNAIEYKVLAKSGTFSDGEGSVLPVLSNRTLLTESKPIWVTQNQLKNYGFEKLKNTQSKTRANHKLTIEYTTNPSWLALKALPYLMEYPYQCAEQTFSRFYANALGRHLMKSNPKIEEVFQSWQDDQALSSPFEKSDDLKTIMIEESPWIKDLQSDKEQKARLARFFQEQQLNLEQERAITQLKDMQLPSGAFPWFAGGKANYFITRHIVAGIGHLRALNIGLEQQKDLNQIEKKAIKFLDQELVKDYYERYKGSIKKEPPRLNRNVIHYLYTRSFTKDSIVLDEESEKITSYYMTLAKKEWLTQSLYSKGLLALIFHRNGENEMAEKIITSLEEQTVRSEDRGWYWKENRGGWYWYNSAIETQAILIEAFSEISTNKMVIDQLKLWLLYHKQGNHWDNSKSTTEAIYALLMNGDEWLDTQGDYNMVIGGKQIPNSKTSETKNTAETGYVKLSWKPQEINSNFSDIRIENNNAQPIMGGVYWQYFEDLDNITASKDTPLGVTKKLYLKQADANGEKLVPITSATPISIGDVVTVRLKLIVKDDMEFVHLKDLRAAGFEPLDVLSKYKWQDGLGYYQTTGDVATNFFFDKMSKGTYIFQYELRANNSGNFSNGFAKIQSMYAPQFGGNSKGQRVQIKK